MSKTLEECIRELRSVTGKFKPYAFFESSLDAIEVTLEDAESYWVQQNPYVSIAYARDDHRVVGFSIASPQKIIDEGTMRFEDETPAV